LRLRRWCESYCGCLWRVSYWISCLKNEHSRKRHYRIRLEVHYWRRNLIWVQRWKRNCKRH
jgi:hypothetical protein